MRKSCLHTDDCTPGRRGGICPRCHPEVSAASSERLRRLHADPEFTKRRCSAEAFAKHARTRMRNIGVAVGAEDDYRNARKKGFSMHEAAHIANASLMEKAPCPLV